MKEIEIKILDIDVINIKTKLESIGGVCKTPRREVTAWLFDDTNGSIKNNNQVLRVRKNGDIAEITFKGPRAKNSEYKIAEEIETTVTDAEKMIDILKHLGFQVDIKHTKYRTTYQFQNALIEIEECPGIPPYIEIEGNETSIQNAVSALGYSWQDTKNIGGVKVYAEYGLDIHDFCD